MSQNVNRAVLFNSSSATDVQTSGGYATVLGLSAIPTNRIVNISQINYRAEVSQVITVAATTYVPTASTLYTVIIGDSNRRAQGYTEPLRKYSYLTPPVITTIGASAALQSEFIHLALVAKINAQSTSNYVVAASLTGGNGFTITDAPGYYPYNRQGMNTRAGASRVVLATNADGTGFASTNLAVTTAAVYSVGVGADLLNIAPVMDFMTGNVTSGSVDAPKTFAGAFAVSGQKYNCFSITYLSNNQIAGVTGTEGLLVKQRNIWVDNGTGAAVTNLAGYLAFEKRMHQLMYAVYKNDACTVAEFFDKNFLIQGPLGAVPVTTTSLTNKFITPYGLLEHVNIGTQTIVGPAQSLTGLLIDQDIATGDGAQYSPSLATANPQEFVVGKTAFMGVFNYTATDVTGVISQFGFRKKEAFALDYNNYTELATIGSLNTTGKFSTNGILGNAATVITTSTTTGLVNAVKTQFIVKVDILGVVTCLANGVAYPVYSAGTTPLVFAAGTIMVPFFQTTQITGTASVGLMDEMLAVSTDKLIA